jgi:hypothetical protein
MADDLYCSEKVYRGVDSLFSEGEVGVRELLPVVSKLEHMDEEVEEVLNIWKRSTKNHSM